MTDLNDLLKLVTDLKNSIMEIEGDLEYRCALATNTICRILPEAEHIKGTYNGEQHYWSAVDVQGQLIILDATVSQFADAPEVFVGVAMPEWEGVSFGNTQIESGCNDQAIMEAMSAKGWIPAA